MNDTQKTSFLLQRYKLQGIEIDSKYLQTLITKASHEAVTNYKKLVDPIMSKQLYIKHWINSSVTRDISEKGLQYIQPFDFQRSATFFETYPPELRAKYQKEIWRARPEDRQFAWDNLDVPYQKIEDAFRGLAGQRNDIIFKKGHKTPIDYYLKLYNILPKDYDNFVKISDKVILYCNKQLAGFNKSISNIFFNEFSNPCYICLLDDFPFKNLDDVKKYIYKNNNLLNIHQEKIDIIFGASSNSSYLKEIDRFNIQIDKNANLRHQSIDLIHEFSHIHNRLALYKKDILPEEKGIYSNEFEALKVEMDFLKQISTSLYKAIFGEFLKVFRRVLFEIELYQNLNQNVSKLYAKVFNRCHAGSNQLVNRSYILDNSVIENPFATLPHAIAQSQLITTTLNF